MLCISRSAWRARASTPRHTARQSQWLLVLQQRQAFGTTPQSQDDDQSALLHDQIYSKVRTPPGRPIGYHVLGTLTSNTPSQTTIGQLLEPLVVQSSDDDIGKKGPGWPTRGPPLLSLLLTPAFARHALDPEFPLQVWQRLSRIYSQEIGLNALTAVVDKLPSTTPGEEIGEEGLAYLISAQENGHGSEVRFRDRFGGPQQIQQRQPGNETPGILEFMKPTAAFGWPDRPRWWDQAIMTLQLPLAQTIFSTGRVSTMSYARYERSSLKANFELKERTDDLASFTINVPFGTRDLMRTHIPLVPLTPLRKVDHCVGNIVRRISNFGTAAEQSVDTSQPASSELEKSISAYFSTVNIDPQPVNVWALILPRSEMESGDKKRETRILSQMQGKVLEKTWIGVASDTDLWKTLESRDQNLLENPSALLSGIIRKTLAMGARMCKVLSGGGGWGKKAGLLSLDPEDGYDVQKEHVAPAPSPKEYFAGAEGDFNIRSVQDEKKKALGEMVKEGDGVMFFLATHSLNNDSQSAISVSQMPEYHPDTWAGAAAERSLVFGAIPSTIDTIPGSSPVEATEQGVQVQHHPNLFGMLSESGMALKIAMCEREAAEDAGPPVEKTTKLDVPFTTLKIAARVPEKRSRPWVNGMMQEGKSKNDEESAIEGGNVRLLRDSNRFRKCNYNPSEDDQRAMAVDDYTSFDISQQASRDRGNDVGRRQPREGNCGDSRHFEYGPRLVRRITADYEWKRANIDKLGRRQFSTSSCVGVPAKRKKGRTADTGNVHMSLVKSLEFRLREDRIRDFVERHQRLKVLIRASATKDPKTATALWKLYEEALQSRKRKLSQKAKEGNGMHRWIRATVEFLERLEREVKELGFDVKSIRAEVEHKTGADQAIVYDGGSEIARAQLPIRKHIAARDMRAPDSRMPTESPVSPVMDEAEEPPRTPKHTRPAEAVQLHGPSKPTIRPIFRTFHRIRHIRLAKESTHRLRPHEYFEVTRKRGVAVGRWHRKVVANTARSELWDALSSSQTSPGSSKAGNEDQRIPTSELDDRDKQFLAEDVKRFVKDGS